MSRLLKAEQPHHVRAFEFYNGLGDKRSFALVAAEMGINVNSAKLWSRSFDWKRRIAERENEVIQQVRQRTMSDAVAERERTLKMIRATKNRLMREILEGTAKAGAVGDFVKLVQLEREFLREPDPNHPHGNDPNAPPNVVIYIPENGRRGTAPGRAVDINNPLHPDYRKPKPADENGPEIAQ